MTNKRPPSAKSHARHNLKKPAKTQAKKSSALKAQRHVGISLGGGKSGKACIAVLEYFPEQEKLFLAEVVENISSDEMCSADQKIVSCVNEIDSVESLSVDAALKLPKCLRCRLECPGYENCTEPEIEWMWEKVLKSNEKKRPKKLFTPYTERCAEVFINTELEEKFSLGHAFGANRAPISARALFIQRRLNIKMNEVSPAVSLWRIGRSLRLMKRYLRNFRNAVRGKEARAEILKKVLERRVSFIYDQDCKLLIENGHAFEAYICAMTGFLKAMSLCEKRPKGFPRAEAWIEIPQTEIQW